MKNLLKRIKSTRGEGYVDITVAVLIIMILLAGVIKIAPVFITKMTLNSRFVFLAFIVCFYIQRTALVQ